MFTFSDSAIYTIYCTVSLSNILLEIQQNKLEAASFNFDSRRALRSRFHRSWRVLSLDEQQLFASLSLLEEAAFLRRSAGTLAEIIGRSKQRGKPSSPPFLSPADVVSTSAEQMVAKLVAYALVEPVEQDSMHLHPLLREYAHERLDEIGKVEPGLYAELLDRAKDENMRTMVLAGFRSTSSIRI